MGCTSQVEHSIETGDAKPIKRHPYRIPHALKPVVDEHIDDMIKKEIIEPSMSPWSSSIVLVQRSHADALSRNVNVIKEELVLSKEKMKDTQRIDELCEKNKQYEDFWLDEDGVLYYQAPKTQPRIVIPAALVPTVLACYHELPFTAHQGVSRTVDFISRKYWWKILRSDVSELIGKCEACAKRKAGHRVTAPLEDALEAHEFLDIVSLDIVGPLPVTERGNKY